MMDSNILWPLKIDKSLRLSNTHLYSIFFLRKKIHEKRRTLLLSLFSSIETLLSEFLEFVFIFFK